MKAQHVLGINPLHISQSQDCSNFSTFVNGSNKDPGCSFPLKSNFREKFLQYFMETSVVHNLAAIGISDGFLLFSPFLVYTVVVAIWNKVYVWFYSSLFPALKVNLTASV